MIKRWFKDRGCKSAHHEDGQALVELALTAPLLFFILFGAVEFARFSYAGVEVSNAARAAVQYAAMNGGYTSDTVGMLNAAQADSFDMGQTVAITVDPPANSCSDGSTYSASTGCASPAHVMTVLTVHTSTDFYPLVSWKGLPTHLTLQGYAKQQVLGL
jgi:Flp pilus assembly protein TadG